MYSIICLQGLESLVQKPATCLSLVSEGAECIFISKRLFLSLANIKVLRVVTDMVIKIFNSINLYCYRSVLTEMSMFRHDMTQKVEKMKTLIYQS